MWTVVYMTQSMDGAIEMEKLLGMEGILVKLKSAPKRDSLSENNYEILVPAAEVEEAHSVIVEKGF